MTVAGRVAHSSPPEYAIMGMEVPDLPAPALRDHCVACEHALKHRLHPSQLDYIGAFASQGPAQSALFSRLLARRMAASFLAPGACIARDASGRPYVINKPHISLAFTYAPQMAFTAMIQVESGKEAPMLAIDAESSLDAAHLGALCRHFSKLCGGSLISSISSQNLRTLWLLYECGIKIFGHTDGSLIKSLIQHTEGHIPDHGSLPYHQCVLYWRLHRIMEVQLCVAASPLTEDMAGITRQTKELAYA